MLLAVNVGNTSIGLGVYEGGTLKRRARIPAGEAMGESWPVEQDRRFDAIAIASVNPPVSDRLEKWLRRAYDAPVYLARRDFPLPIAVECTEPEKVGADRLLNAIAAYRLVRRECVVVDMGTAVTVDAVSASGAFLGGAIFPGAGLCSEALHNRTALLPQVSPAKPSGPIGRCTVDAIASGLFWGLGGAADRLISEMKEALGGSSPVIATGGDAAFLKEASHLIERIVPDLTLDGLRIAFEETRA